MARAAADSAVSVNKPVQHRLINPRIPRPMRFPVKVRGKARVWDAAKAARAVAVPGLANEAVAEKARAAAAAANR